MSTAQVPICKVQDNSSWLGECFIACVLQHVSASVYENIRDISSETVGKSETLYPPLGRFVGHVLFCSKPASKLHHCFIHCQLTTWVVACVESCKQRVEQQRDFVDSFHSTRGMASMKQPEEQFESVTRHHPIKNGTSVTQDVFQYSSSCGS